MSSTLGEKLRQAREARGITISEVAEQTRIAPLYIESIEKDDYQPLPGGIFNKGFVKSFAKYVGVDEQEALQDYAQLVAGQGNQIPDESKTYNPPKVLTNDRGPSSSTLTIIFAVLILGLMTWGILTLVNYIQNNQTQTTATSNSNVNANTISNISLTNANAAPTPAASLNNLKIEIKAVKSAVSLVSTADGESVNALLKTDESKTFEPKESLRFKYSKSKSKNVQILINGKEVSPPSAPENANRSAIEFEINKNNVQRILESGQITYDGMPSAKK